MTIHQRKCPGDGHGDGELRMGAWAGSTMDHTWKSLWETHRMLEELVAIA